MTRRRDGKLLLWDLNLEEDTTKAQEIPLERSTTKFGISPITSVVWWKTEELKVVFEDVTVMMGA